MLSTGFEVEPQPRIRSGPSPVSAAHVGGKLNVNTDILVAVLALILGLLFLASAFGNGTGLDQLRSIKRLRSLRGGRAIQVLLGVLLIVISAAVFSGWRMFPPQPQR